MKRLIEESEPALSTLTQLVASSAPHQSSPFAKRHVYSRIQRALEASPSRAAWRPALLATAGLLIAATAAAAGYSIVAPEAPALTPAPFERALPPAVRVAPAPASVSPVTPPPVEPEVEVGVKDEKPSERRVERPPRPGEDPTQVAEAVRALRKQGDPARAQALLDQYLRSNPRGALSEDALALSIEAAAARKDPRAADYARRYLARYPQGRFRPMAERVLAK